MEIVYFGIITVIIVLAVGYIMHLRSNKLLLEARMESNIILAAATNFQLATHREKVLQKYNPKHQGFY